MLFRSNLIPSKDALILEDSSSPYANLVVVKEGHEKDPMILELVNALHSDAVVKKAEQLFGGQALPAWK